MMKNVIKLIAIAVITIATLTLTGCAENREKPLDVNEIVNSVFEESSTPSEIEENSTSEVEATSTSNVENSTSSTVEKPTASTSEVESKPEEKPVSSSTSTVEKPVEKPTSSTTTTSSKPASTTTTTSSKPVSSSTPASSTPVSTTSSTTSKPVEKPTASSTTTTSSTTSKPVEKPVEKPAYNCDIDGHIWEVTTTTTEPKWCQEVHNVYDYGFDVTLAERLYPNLDNPYKTYKNTLLDMGVDGASGSATITVEVWGTETYEDKKCTVCNHSEVSVNVCTITPIGEWQYRNGVNPRITDSRLNFNTLFYDPYNIPQIVIDNIILHDELIWD